MYPQRLQPFSYVMLSLLTAIFFLVQPDTVLGVDLKGQADLRHSNSRADLQSDTPVVEGYDSPDLLILDILGEARVPSVLCQPELPPQLLPSGIPVVRPGRKPEVSKRVEPVLLGDSLPAGYERKTPLQPPRLLPEREMDTDIVYVIPFTGVMVPDDVYGLIFDQFVDEMNAQAGQIGLNFVILKQGQKVVGKEWLGARKYITGEIYSYVEEAGCCATAMRTKARLSYYRPNQVSPAFDQVFQLSAFFDHESSTLDLERAKLAGNMVEKLTGSLLPVFGKALLSEQTKRLQNNGV